MPRAATCWPRTCSRPCALPRTMTGRMTVPWWSACCRPTLRPWPPGSSNWATWRSIPPWRSGCGKPGGRPCCRCYCRPAQTAASTNPTAPATPRWPRPCWPIALATWPGWPPARSRTCCPRCAWTRCSGCCRNWARPPPAVPPRVCVRRWHRRCLPCPWMRPRPPAGWPSPTRTWCWPTAMCWWPILIRRLAACCRHCCPVDCWTWPSKARCRRD